LTVTQGRPLTRERDEQNGELREIRTSLNELVVELKAIKEKLPADFE